MPTYSFGADSPLKFDISDKMASLYNDAVEQFFKAHVRFNQKFGRSWDPSVDPIEISWTRRQKKAWNDFAKLFNRVVAEYDKGQGHYHPNDIMGDYLVKNAVESFSTVKSRWGRVITLAAGVGAAYVLLRGL